MAQRTLHEDIVKAVSDIDKEVSKFPPYLIHPIFYKIKFTMKSEGVSQRLFYPEIFINTYDIIPIQIWDLGIIRGIRYKGEKQIFDSQASPLIRAKSLDLVKPGGRIHEEAIGTFITGGKVEPIKVADEIGLAGWHFFFNFSKPFLKSDVNNDFIFPSPFSFFSVSQAREITGLTMFSSIALLDFTNSQKKLMKIPGTRINKDVQGIEAKASLVKYSIPSNSFGLSKPFSVFIPLINTSGEDIIPKEEVEEWGKDRKVVSNFIFIYSSRNMPIVISEFSSIPIMDIILSLTKGKIRGIWIKSDRNSRVTLCYSNSPCFIPLVISFPKDYIDVRKKLEGFILHICNKFSARDDISNKLGTNFFVNSEKDRIKNREKILDQEDLIIIHGNDVSLILPPMLKYHFTNKDQFDVLKKDIENMINNDNLVTEENPKIVLKSAGILQELQKLQPKDKIINHLSIFNDLLKKYQLILNNEKFEVSI